MECFLFLQKPVGKSTNSTRSNVPEGFLRVLISAGYNASITERNQTV
jgi:hypothetical protein